MGDGAGGEGFYVAEFGAVVGGFFVPAGEGSEEEEAKEGEDDGDDARDLVSIDTKNRMERDLVWTHIRYGNTILSLNVDATHIRFNGS